MSAKKLWEMQEKDGKCESPKAFQAFTTYRDLGPDRSFVKVAVLLGRTRQVVSLWANQWYWKSRILAWEEELDRRKRERKFKDIEEMHIRHAKHAQSVENALMVPIQAFLKKINKDQTLMRDNEFDNTTQQDLFDLVTTIADKLPKVVDIERKSRGEPTEINSYKIDLNSLTEDELEKLATTGTL